VAKEADLLLMVKPQFEVGKGQVGKGGVVRDEGLRQQAVEKILACARALGYTERGRVDSRVTGPKGNREIFVWLGG
jgi:23S rRNA (cytidine1920-2'-O)/16S rRNA (cytidine1409-2'-O)-methyltransferase